MGAGNALIAQDRWSEYVHPGPMRGLIRMCLVSLDGELEPRYWAGWAPLARALGTPAPAGCEKGEHVDPYPKPREGECRACAAPQRAASRCIASLLEAKVIKQTGRSAYRQNAEFTLLINSLPVVEKREKPKPPPRERRTVTVRCASDGDRPVYDGRPPSETPDGDRPSEEKPGRRSGTETGIRSPKSGTSPRATLTYPQAAKILEKLPDLGSALLEQIDASEHPPTEMRERIIAAASLALGDAPTLRAVAGDLQ